MQIDPSSLSNQEIYRLLVGGVVPRPIAWVSTISADGVANLAPYSFFTVASCQPPVLSVTQVNPRDRREKDTLNNLRQTGEGVVHIVSAELVEAMNQSSGDYPADVSEFDAARLDSTQSTVVSAPRVSAAKVAYECRFRQALQIADTPGAGTVMLLDVVGIYVDDSVLDQGFIQPEGLDAVGKMGRDDFTTTRDRFTLVRPQITGS